MMLCGQQWELSLQNQANLNAKLNKKDAAEKPNHIKEI
jgi:hypothetical protein